MLRRMGLGSKWRRWIIECVSLAKFSIMIKEFPHGFFLASRGLRLGDPLSPFLLSVVGEAVSRILTAAGDANLISSFKLASIAPRITRLQFADDTIIFCRVEEEQVKNLLAILRCFEAVSGLKVNLAKGALIGISTDELDLDRFVNILGCTKLIPGITFMHRGCF